MTASAHALVKTDLAEASGVLSSLRADQRTLLDDARARLMAGDDGAVHAVSLVLDETIEVPLYSLGRVERDFARLAAKAEASSLPVPRMTEVSRTETHALLNIIGGAPVFNGWRLVADLEQRTQDDGARTNLVRTARGQTCPAEYRDAPEQCLHCGTARKRNRTFVIQHEDGRMTQVGSTCLDSYLGSQALTAWLTWGRLADAVDGWGAEVFDDDMFASYRGHVSRWGASVDPMTFLRVVCAEARVHGFATSSGSLTPDMATGRVTWSGLQRADHEPVTSPDVERAEEIWQHIDAMGGSEFAHNLRTIAGSKVEWRDANTFAAAYLSHAREAARLNEHTPHAQVGDKVVLDLTITGMPHSDYEGEFGWVRKYFVKMVDGEGRVVVWPTTNPNNAVDGEGLAVGESYRIVAKIMVDGEGRVVVWPTTNPNNAVDGEGLAVGESYRIVAKIRTLGSYDGKAETTITARAASLREPGEVAKSAPVMRKWAKTREFDCPAWAWTKAQIKRAAKSA